MKKLLIFSLTFLPLISFCQNSDTPNAKKIAIVLTFSPDYCYRTLKSDASSKWIADSRDTFEIPKFGYTAGLNLALNISKRITIETGLLYSDKGEKTKKYDLIWGQPNPDLPIKNTFIYHYIYLDIPIKINYYLFTQRAKLFITAGISPNIFITQKTTSILEYSDGHTKTNSSTADNGFSKIDLTFIAGFGVSYDLTNRITLKIEPTFRRSIIPISTAPVKEYLYSMGLNTGIYFKF